MSRPGTRVLLGLVVLCGCASSRPGGVHRFGKCQAAVRGNDILCGSRPVARIECYGQTENSCRALAVRYTDGNVAWLYQAPWFDPGRPESAYERQTASDRVSNVSVTGDATYLWYRTEDESGTRWNEYDLQAGSQRPVDRFRIVQLRGSTYRNDVFDVPLIDPARDLPPDQPADGQPTADPGRDLPAERPQ